MASIASSCANGVGRETAQQGQLTSSAAIIKRRNSAGLAPIEDSRPPPAGNVARGANQAPISGGIASKLEMESTAMALRKAALRGF